MSSIDDLKAQFSTGFAKPNQYKVVLPETTNSRRLNIMCDSVTLPGKQIFTAEENISFKTEYTAYGYGTEDVDISFFLANDWFEWNYLYEWMGQVTTVNSQVIQRVSYKSSYTRQVDIEHLSTDRVENNTKKKITLINAFPVSLNSIDLGNENSNQVIKVSASFKYDNWIENY